METPWWIIFQKAPSHKLSELEFEPNTTVDMLDSAFFRIAGTHCVGWAIL